jgi:hypothetical protein
VSELNFTLLRDKKKNNIRNMLLMLAIFQNYSPEI